MKQVILFLSILLFGINACTQTKEEVRKKTDRIETLEAAFVQLDSLLGVAEIEKIKQMSEGKFAAESHSEIGTWIRNNWIRQDKLGFTEKWQEKGAKHMDDYSSIILISYYRYLMGRNIDLDGQLAFYNNYWMLRSLPERKDFPNDIKTTSSEKQYHYKIHENEEATLFLLLNTDKNSFWLYNYFYGWKQIDKEAIEDLEKNLPLTLEYVESLFSTKEE